MKEIKFGKAAALTSPDPLVLVCTKKEDGTLNMAPVSFFMYASFVPPMLAFAMSKPSNSGENIRRDKKAVIAVPGTSIADAVMKYGMANGGKKDKLAETPIALQSVEGSDIQIPEDCKVAFVISLDQTIEVGDHYMYVCAVDKVYGDDTKEALFAWKGYTKIAPAQEKTE